MGFSLETAAHIFVFGQVDGQHLERNFAPIFRVQSAIHHRHATEADLADDDIGADLFGSGGHGQNLKGMSDSGVITAPEVQRPAYVNCSTSQRDVISNNSCRQSGRRNV
jgi:hypothetical protein